MAKKTPKQSLPTAAPAHAPKAHAPAAERALAAPTVLVPNTAPSVVLEFSLDEDGDLEVATHTVVAWQIGSMVEPVIVARMLAPRLYCLVEAHGSEMSYTFLDDGEDEPLRFTTITAARLHARAALGGA